MAKDAKYLCKPINIDELSLTYRLGVPFFIPPYVKGIKKAFEIK